MAMMLRPTKRPAAASSSSGAARSSSSDQNDYDDRHALLQRGSNLRHSTQPYTIKRSCKSICLLLSLLLVSFPLVMKLDRANPVGLRVQKSIAEHNNDNDQHKTRINVTNHCEVPSLPRNTGMHIIVGGYRRKEPGFEMTDKHNYLGDIGVTNADVYWYRRIHPEIPQAEPTPLGDTEQEGCGMVMHEL